MKTSHFLIIILIFLSFNLKSQILIDENFSSGLPVSWTNTAIQGSDTWVFRSNPIFSSESGGQYAVFDDNILGSGTTPNEAALTTKPFNCTGRANVTLRFNQFWSAVEFTHGYVEVSNNGGLNWIIVADYQTTTIGSLASPDISSIDLSAQAANQADVRVRFRYTDGNHYGNYWYIDDVKIFSEPDVGITKLVNPSYLACTETFSNAESITVRIYNFSAEDISNVPVTCQITGGASITWNETFAGTIPSDSFIDYTFTSGTVDMSADDVYHFNISTTYAGDGNLTNNILNVGRRQLVQTYPYVEDFNISKAGWSASGSNMLADGVYDPYNNVHNHGREFLHADLPYLNGPEGEGSSWYVEVADNTYSTDVIWVESPVFDFSNNTKPVLSMDIKHQLQNYVYSAFRVEYSVDGGAWTKLGTTSDPNWYNYHDTFGWGNSYLLPVNNWLHVEHDLCELSGESCVKFRISGRSYYYQNEYHYFAFDNFEISEGEGDDIQPLEITLSNGGTCAGFTGTETVQVLLKNNTCRPLTNIPVSLQIDGGAIINETVPGPINRFETSFYTFTTTADLSAAGDHVISVTTNLATDNNNTNDNKTQIRKNTPITTYPYLADFNANNQGWVSRPDVNHRYFRNDVVPYLNGAEGQGKSWYSEVSQNTYSTSLLSVESPVFDLTGMSNPILYLDIKHQLQNYVYSAFRLEYSINGGNWTKLGTTADPNWYNYHDTYGWGNSIANPVNEWTTYIHNLCEIAALTPAEKSCVKFRISGRSYYYQDEHCYFAFDNFKIEDTPEVGVSAIINPDINTSGCLYDQNQTVTIQAHNYGCGAINNVPVKCEINFPAGHPNFPSMTLSGTVPVIPADGNVNYTFAGTFDMTPMGDYEFTAYTELPADTHTENDTSSVIISVNFPKITAYPYLEDFNTDEGYWTTSGANPPLNHGRQFSWGALPYLDGPEGEGNSWFVEITDNLYSTDVIWVESPVFDFSYNTNPVLSMDIKHQLQTYVYSAFRVEYSTDGDSVWTKLGTTADPNWYNYHDTFGWGNSYSAPVNDWLHVEHDLCELSGESCVKFRISGRSYYFQNEYHYFAFDNFEISSGESDDIQPIAITLPDGGACTGYTNSETIEVLLINNKCRPLYNIPISVQIDGGAIINEVVPGPVNRFETYLYTFTTVADISAAGNHTISVTTNLATDGDNSNDNLVEIRINTPIGTYPYTANFDTDNNGWVSRPDVNHRYFRNDVVPYLNGAEGQGKSWYSEVSQNTYSTSLLSVESPIFDFSAVTNPILFMDIKHQLQNYVYSAFRVEYSINGGNWTKLGTTSDPNWYNYHDTYGWGNSVANPVDTWTQVQHNLCMLAGQSCVQFRISGRTYYFQEGYSSFAFDNFKIVDAVDVEISEITNPTEDIAGCLFIDAQTVTVTAYNYSCTDQTNIPVTCDISVPASHPDFPTITLNGTIANIPGHGSVSYIFPGTFDMTPVGTYTFDAYTQLAGDYEPNNDHTVSSVNVQYPLISTFPYLEDFNADAGYWKASGTNPPPSIDNKRIFSRGVIPYLNGAEGEGDSWYISITDASYTTDLLWVESPVFDFSALTAPVIFMDIKHQLQNYVYSAFRVEYSVDGGSVWTKLGTTADPSWYNYNDTYGWGNSNAAPFDSWEKVIHNVCFLAGESCVKFRVSGRAYYYQDEYYYFAFDNFEIVDNAQDAAAYEFLNPLPDDRYCTYSANEQITVKFKNVSCNILNNIPVKCEISGVLSQTINGTVTIPAEGEINYTFPTGVDMTGIGTYNFKVSISLPGDVLQSNDTIYQSIEVEYPLLSTFPYYEDFNSGKGFWKESGSNPPLNNGRHFELGTVPYLNGSENNGDAWYIEKTADNYISDIIWVESPVFDFTGLENPIFSMEIKHQLWSYVLSAFRVEYSINGGLSWTKIGNTSDPDWYNYHDTYGWGNSNANPFDEWTYVEHNLCMLKNESCVKFRISGHAYYYQDQRYYFAFDNVSITDGRIDAQTTDTRGCWGSEYSFDVQIQNRNNFCQLFNNCNFNSGNVLDFDGENDRVSIGTLPALTNFTIEYYVKPNGTDATYDRITSIQNNRFETAKSNDGSIRFYSPTIGWRDTGRDIQQGVWSHIAYVSNGSNITVYINGENVYQYNANVSITNTDWFLGGLYSSGSNSNISLDEVRIWDVARTEEEIRANICGSLSMPQANLVAYYQMEDGTGSTSLTDVTGNSHTGTLQNMDENTDWSVSDLAGNNVGVATEPDNITSIDIGYSVDGAAPVVATFNAPVDFNEITPGSFEWITIPNVLIPNGYVLGQNLATGGIASASSEYNANNVAANAFNNDESNFGWGNNNAMPSWLQYDFGAGNSEIINTYKIYCSSTQNGSWNSESYNPSTWIFEGSDDAVLWTSLDNVTTAGLTRNIWSTFSFTNTTAYRYYRISISANESGNRSHITELEFYNAQQASNMQVWCKLPNAQTDEIITNDTINADISWWPNCNDHCSNAIELLNTVTSATQNNSATPDPTEDPDYLACAGGTPITVENSVWYYFTTNCRGGEVTVSFLNTNCSPASDGIQVSIDRLDQEPNCNPANYTNVFCSAPGDESNIVWHPNDLLPETQYYITIDGVGGNTCDFEILLEGNISFNPINAMTGNRNINGSGNFPTIQSAIDSLNVYGVQSPVTFSVSDINYNEQILLGPVCGANETNTITFETWCDDCGSATIQHDADATDNYTLKIWNASHIIFKRFEFEATGSTNTRVVELALGADSIRFEDCKFTGISTTGNSDTEALVYTNNEDVDNINFINNTFTNGSFGLYFAGNNPSSLSEKLNVQGNTFTNQSFAGIYGQYLDAPLITGNTITTNSARTDFSAIAFSNISNNFEISGNKTSTTTASGNGLFLDYAAGTNGNQGIIANNMFSVGNAGASYGINIESTSGNSEYLNIYYNSTNSLSGTGAGIRINNANNLDVQDNIFNSNSATSYDVTGLTLSTENYNNFFPDFAGKGLNSISINPSYQSLTDLHTNNAGLATGSAIAGITIDIDGETRQATPYIGADEYLGNISWTGNIDTDWNKAGNWDKNTLISAYSNVIIPTTPAGGNFPETNSHSENFAESHNLTIQNGAHLYIAPAKYLTVWGDLNQNGTFILQSDATGTGSFINKGAINYGGASVTTVQRYINGANWHYVSSPITTGNSNLFNSPNFYFYNETTDDYWNMNTFTGGLMGWEIANGAMNIMQGYATYQLEQTVNFTGTLNTGNQTFNLDYTDNTATHGDPVFDGWNLIGNPYPSSLNWDDVDNISRTNVDAAIYFYKDNGTGNYNNYTYFIPQSLTSLYPPIAVNRVSGCVPVSQGFFVKANAPAASIQLTNAARIHNSVTFYKNTEDFPSTIRLSVENENFEDETVIRFIPESTTEYDGEFDAFKLSGNSTEIPFIYSFTEIDSLNLAINSLPDISTETVVPLGFRAGNVGDYTIKIKRLILPDNLTAYLFDKYLNKKTNLSQINFYDFSSEEGNFRNRFEIVFETEGSNISDIRSEIKIYSYKKMLTVNLPEIPREKTLMIVTDISGKEILNRFLHSDKNNFDLNNYASGIYFVKVITNNKISFKKVILGN